MRNLGVFSSEEAFGEFHAILRRLLVIYIYLKRSMSLDIKCLYIWNKKSKKRLTYEKK